MGVPPTPRKARTGELTPPGMYFWACSNRVSECVMSWLLLNALRKLRTMFGKQPAKFEGAFCGGINVGAEKPTGHRQQIGTSPNQRFGVAQGNAANGGHREFELFGQPQHLRVGRGSVGFCGRWIKPAKCQI